MLFLWKYLAYFPDCPKPASTKKDKWEFKAATQYLCDESQKSEFQSGY